MHGCVCVCVRVYVDAHMCACMLKPGVNLSFFSLRKCSPLFLILKQFYFIYLSFMSLCAFIHVYECYNACMKVIGQLVWVSPFTMLVPGIKFRLLGLVAITLLTEPPLCLTLFLRQKWCPPIGLSSVTSEPPGIHVSHPPKLWVYKNRTCHHAFFFFFNHAFWG